MLTLASVLVAGAGIGVLVYFPLPKQRKERMLQQALGTVLVTVGIAGFISVVFLKGQIIG